MANITSGAKMFLEWTPSTVNPHFSAGAVSGVSTNRTFGDLAIGQQLARVSMDTTVGAPNMPFPGGQAGYSTLWVYGGSYKVTGKVEINTVVVASKWVYLFPEGAPSYCIGAQYTSSNGVFTFIGLAAGKYKVYAMDPNFNYNGKLFENISAVPM